MRNRILTAALPLLAALALSTPSLVFAQTSKGNLVGVVRDTSGAVVANATISLTNEATGETRQLTSNPSGEYRVDAIAPGSYSLDLTATGFEEKKVAHLNVAPSTYTNFDVVLNVGGTSETVAVQAQTNLINTENAQLSQNIGSAVINNLPIFSLNAIELAYASPGVQLVDQGNLGNGVSVQVNGSRPRANNFLIDGQEINDPGIAGQALQPQLPAIFDSVSVITNSAAAEYGGAGGGIINMVTKSGTSKFHGGAWELYSGSGLNALDGQQRQLPHTHGLKARFNEHQIGFSIGGPIYKQKVFGFGSGQWSRIYGNETAAVNLLPDAGGIATLQALSPQYPNAATLLGLLDEGTYLQSFSQITSQGTTTVNLGPDALGNPRPAVTFGQFQRPPVPQSSPDTQWAYRIDWLPRPNDTLYIRYLHDRTSLSPDFFTNATSLPGFDTIQAFTSEQFAGTWTHVFSPRLLNEFRVSELRTNGGFDFAPATLANPLAITPTVTLFAEQQAGFPNIGAPSGYPQGSAQDIYQGQDTITWTHGMHTLRAGADVGREIIIDKVPFDFYGTLTFQSGGGYSDLGNYIDNYLGPSGTATIDIGSNRVDPHSYNQAYFAQDDIKFSPEFTMNLGVRYEYRANPENSLQYPALDPNNLTAPINTRIKVNEDYNNIAPRIGIAYAPHGAGWFGRDKSVYHAGFGIFYDSVFTNIVDNSQASAPNISSPQAISTTGRGLTGASSLIGTLSPVVDPSSTVTSVVNNLVNPQTYQWNLGFERQLPSNVKLTANYVGVRAEKLFANQQYNYFDPNTGERLNPNRGVINARGNFADSIYHALELNASHEFTHNFLINASYTYSKSMDDGSEVFTLFNQSTSYAANLAPGGRAAEWSPSAYDHTHYFAVQYVYQIPGYNREHILSLITSHWTISGDTVLQSGPPSTWSLSGIDTNQDGSAANDRPVLSNAKAPYTSIGIDGAYLGPDAVTGANPTPGVYYDLGINNTAGTLNPVDPNAVHFLIPTQSGNVGRDSFRQPGVQYWNLAVEKDISASFTKLEGAEFQFRVEAQDVGNHNNVEPLDLNLLGVGGSTFLNPSVARSNVNNGPLAQGRVLRLWAKFNF
ncbi:Oar protein [Acidisarcina polymorpha]|uniref:Oar protein n=1 Tax=Acidisarcina polymorpha TaxID=2211140 RepID=A0A2Z5FRX3_9BACT|nr:carboxypeptidase regulatory-like domain-containing protein [Acidisarcina polymorpha]AXC09458.1 Oar protein [Acidisarcina polymorpha]